jgi:hypothetical protein
MQAHDAWSQVLQKIDDFFARCRWLAFDPKSEKALNVELSELENVSFQDLDGKADFLAKFPLARAGQGATLPLQADLNPYWQERIKVFVALVVAPLFGSTVVQLTEDQWLTIKSYLQPVADWLARKPNGKLAHYPKEKLEALLQ